MHSTASPIRIQHRPSRVLFATLAATLALATVGTAHADDRHERPPAEPAPAAIAPVGAPATAPTDQLELAAAPAPAAPTGPDQLAGLSASGITLTDVSATAHGTWTRFRYTTNAPEVKLLVSDRQPVFANGAWSEPYMEGIIGAETVATTKPGQPMTFNDYYLLPGTTYYYIITVPTAADQVPVQAVGSFTMLRRTLTITFDTVHVTDDSDPGAKGAGDFTFWFQVNGKQVASLSKDIKSDSSYSIQVDGKPLRVVIPDVLHTDVPFGVQVFENDVQNWDSCNHELLAGDTWDGVAIDKENACGTWLGMVDQYNASPGKYKVGYGWQEGETIEFDLAPYKSSVHLTVSGTITAVWA